MREAPAPHPHPHAHAHVVLQVCEREDEDAASDAAEGAEGAEGAEEAEGAEVAEEAVSADAAGAAGAPAAAAPAAPPSPVRSVDIVDKMRILWKEKPVTLRTREGTGDSGIAGTKVRLVSSTPAVYELILRTDIEACLKSGDGTSSPVPSPHTAGPIRASAAGPIRAPSRTL